MEKVENQLISKNLIAAILYARKMSHKWFTAAELHKALKVSPRSARGYVIRLVEAGLLDSSPTSPARSYRAKCDVKIPEVWSTALNAYERKNGRGKTKRK